MNSTAILRNGFWRTGENSQPKTSSPSQVLYWEFNTPKALPLPNTVSLSSLLRDFESDPAMAADMSSARKELAQTLYRDEPATLSHLRLAAGMSQAELALRSGTSQSHIARIEGGTTDPGTDVISRIANALDRDEAIVFQAVRHQLATRVQQE